MYSVPVLFLIFNRPDTTRQVFEAIRNIRPAALYIAADAPRTGNVNDLEKCRQAREVVEEINWTCEVKKLYRNKNLGSFGGVREAIDWFFSQEEMGIILEDDCLPNHDFFLFCEKMLNKFKDNKKIISINGSNLGYKLNDGNSYTFSRFMNMWGWATWRRSANKIDYRLEEWKNERKPLFTLYKRLRQNIFDTDINWYKYWKHKFDLTLTNENITWWDWQWIYHQLRDKQLSVVPSVNLVTNIGFNTQATHTLEESNPAANIPTQPIKFPIVHPLQLRPDLKYEEELVKWVWCYHKRLPAIFFIKSIISSCLKKY